MYTYITSLSNWLNYFGTIFEGVKKALDSKCQYIWYNTHISLSEILKLTDGNSVFLIVVFVSIRRDVTVAVSAIFQIGSWGLSLCSPTLKIKLPEQCIPNVAHRSIAAIMWQTCVSAELQCGPIRHNGAKKNCSWNIKTDYLCFKHFIITITC